MSMGTLLGMSGEGCFNLHLVAKIALVATLQVPTPRRERTEENTVTGTGNW
jgi:hypothetical protein